MHWTRVVTGLAVVVIEVDVGGKGEEQVGAKGEVVLARSAPLRASEAPEVMTVQVRLGQIPVIQGGRGRAEAVAP
jgi:hypothetical protein